MARYLSFSQLTAFLTLAEVGSFRESAERVGVSQPTFSRMIQTIEQRARARLFDRDTHRVTLTPAGAKLLPLARRLVDDYHDTFEQLAEFVDGRDGMIRIATLPWIAATLLPRTIAVFKAQRPDVQFEIWEDVGGPIHRAVKDGSADLGITPLDVPEMELSTRLLFNEEIVLVCRRDHQLVADAAPDWTALARYPYIALSPETGMRTGIDRVLAQLDIATQPLFNCKYPATAASLVAEGMGVTAMTRLAFDQLSIPMLICLPLNSPAITRPIGIITMPGRSLSPVARMFLNELERTARALRPRG